MLLEQPLTSTVLHACKRNAGVQPWVLTDTHARTHAHTHILALSLSLAGTLSLLLVSFCVARSFLFLAFFFASVLTFGFAVCFGLCAVLSGQLISRVQEALFAASSGGRKHSQLLAEILCIDDELAMHRLSAFHNLP